MEIDYLEPTTVSEASELLNLHEGGKAVAGGTAVVLMMQQGLLIPEVLISLRDIDGLSGITEGADSITIGSAVTLQEIATSPVLRERTPSLAKSCELVGNIRVRNAATLGGNLAEGDYASDPPTVLAGLDATVVADSARGERRIAARDLVTGFYETALERDEIITRVEVRPMGPDERALYLKYVSRSSEDRPCVGVAARAKFSDELVDELSIVVGAVASSPQRLDDVEDQAVGARLETDMIERLADAYSQGISPLEDARGSAWYRKRMIRVFVKRALTGLASNGAEGS
ncbi:MAG: FAD binding domain-containing protein [Actinomycetota bacterium]